MAWNLEHLDDIDGEGCLDRTGPDYAAIARQIEALNADIVAVQEVENEAAARRVFPASRWDVAMSSRPPIKDPPGCRDRPEARLGHLATGFAIRRGIVWHRNEDHEVLGTGNAFQRWGTDITVMGGGQELRLLSVHLRSSCGGAEQDGDRKRKKTCATLRAQIGHVKAWADARRALARPFLPQRLAP